MNASASARVAPEIAVREALAPLAAILGAGLVLRLLFIGSEGFHNDIGAFESWATTLRDNPPWLFYKNAGFADYPPGYFLVLWVIGHLYALVPGSAADPAHGYSILRALVKLPAIAMDLVDAGLVFAIARRYASRTVALVAAALLALNPGAIYVSAYWGQVDSVSWGLVLVALWCVLRAGDEERKTVPRLTWAWLAFGFSLLMKPQAATVGFMLLAYPFATADAPVRARRLAGTALGIVAAFVFAVLVGLLFHPQADVLGWLLGRYTFGSGVYAYNSVNAFSLYAVRQPFWQSDSVPLSIFGFAAGPLWAWGIGLVAAATALIVGRYLQRRDERALLEGAMLCALAFFVLATRMHERYIYGAFLLAMPLVAFGRTGFWSAIVLSVTMYLNLAYSFAYQVVMEAKLPNGPDPTNLWPLVSHPAALANVALLFWLTFRYLGNAGEAVAAAPAHGARDELTADAFGLARIFARGRAWFDPREGIAAMTRVDWLIAGGMTLASFVVMVAWVWYPPDKIFDEIYYARAGEEYLKHLDVSGWGPFEFTHPPLTKLIITLSMMLFGGLHGLGDTALGWRFLNVVVGALTVGVVYCFAKRLCGSTPFAAFAALMLACDGFHYVQSRIATPEITVAFFSLLTLYAFYRLWLAAQVARRVPLMRPGAVALGATAAAGIVAGLVVALWVVPHASGPITVRGVDYVGSAQQVAFVWTFLLVWLLGRTLVVPRVSPPASEVSYADGSRVIAGDATGLRLETPEGASLALAAVRKDKPVVREQADGLQRTVDATGTLSYVTPTASATYRPDATADVAGTTIRAADARVWWVALALFAALVADSKWNGLFDFVVVFFVAALVMGQRWLRRPAVFGNPFGAPLDLIFASMIVVGGIVYMLSYIPYFTLGHGYVDVIAMQHDMFRYHDTLVATHPYSSVWWQWPLDLRPILYYANYTHVAPKGMPDCCVASIRALPNPFVWWAGLASVPIVAWLAFRERNKGYALLIVAYLFQWLPWAKSPRLAFEYHFFPNLAIICLANAIVLQRIWAWGEAQDRRWARWAVGAYGAVVVGAFVYFFPVLSGTPIPWDAYQARMWLPSWI